VNFNPQPLPAESDHHAGTVLDPARGPAVDAMTWLSSYADVVDAFKSRDVVQGGGGQRDSHPFIGDSVLALYGDNHFERRRIEAGLFRSAKLRSLHSDVLIPAFAAGIAGCPRGRDGRRRGELQTLVRETLCKVSAALVGLDGLESAAAVARYLELSEHLALPVNMEWVTKDHMVVTEEGLVAKRAFDAEFFRPSWERRRQRFESRTDDGAPATDLITIMLQHPEHFGRWDDDLPLREILLFNDGVFSIISGVIHTVGELIEWFKLHPQDRARIEDRGFLRQAALEALRLHPASPFLIRRAVKERTLPSGRVLAAGDYVVLDLVKAGRDPAMFGIDVDRYDPERVPLQKIKRTGLAFGDGPHTCIGLSLSMGEAATDEGEDDVPPGLLLTLVRNFFRAGGDLDPERPPRWRQFNIRKEYAEFAVCFS
jgi:cytochrome P450